MTNQAAKTSGSSFLQTTMWVLVTALVGLAVFGNIYFDEYPVLYRALGVAGLGIVAAFLALQTEKGKAFNQFRKDSFVEMRRVVWPTRQETMQTTIIVVIFVVVIALILFFFDWVLSGVISQFIG